MSHDNSSGKAEQAGMAIPSAPLAGFVRLLNPPPLVTVLRFSGILGRTDPVRTGISLNELDPYIKKAFRPRRLAAVALAVNSPGGSAAQASLIAQRVRALADERNVPLLAFCEDVAASGGYWLACAADEIFADQSSIIGSVGVTSSGFGFVGLLEKLGVERRLHTAGKSKGMLDPFQPEKRNDLRHLDKLQKDIHGAFQDWVRLRRGDRLAGDETELFGGAFWTGQMARDLGLVDGLDGMHAVLQERYGVDVRIKLVNGRRPWFRQCFGLGKGEAYGHAAATLAAVEDRLIWNRYGL